MKYNVPCLNELCLEYLRSLEDGTVCKLKLASGAIWPVVFKCHAHGCYVKSGTIYMRKVNQNYFHNDACIKNPEPIAEQTGDALFKNLEELRAILYSGNFELI